MQDTAATSAMPMPAQRPQSALAASTIGACDAFSCSAGNRPSTAVTASTVAMPASRVPITVARGMVRSGLSIAPAGTVAVSSPSSAHNDSATVALIAAGMDSPLGLNGTKRAGSMNQIAMQANASSGANFSTVSTSWARPASRTPSRLMPTQIHRLPSASAAARVGVAVAGGNNAPTLPAKATAIAAVAHQIEIQ